jgi:acetoin utilization deacetylase AcuC-like enzyme
MEVMMAKTFFIHNYEAFKEHINFLGCPDRPERMNIIKQALKQCNKYDLIEEIKIEINPVPEDYEDALLQIHSEKHVQSVNDSPKNLTALYPIQTVLDSIDHVLATGPNTAFFAIRPPGHHSFDGGANNDDSIDGSDSVGEGFCFYNNVAVAAMYAAEYHHKKSILIIDWDYHHGNGTQNAFFDVKGIHDKIIRARHPHVDVYFLSLHNATIYPYRDDPDEQPHNFGTVNGQAHKQKSYIHNVHTAKKDFLDEKYLPKFKQAVDEALGKFIPDVVFISAGFDARNGDPVARFIEGEGLSDKCYYEMAKYVKKSLYKVNHSASIISLLEGGYNVQGKGFSEAVVEHIKGLNSEVDITIE